MKTVTVPPQATDVNALLSQAREEDILVRSADGTQYMLTVVDDFDEEVSHTRRSPRLMALLDQRATQSTTIPLEEVKRQLGLSP